MPGNQSARGPAGSPTIILEDQQAQNTAGGTFNSGADRTRVINTEVYDPLGLCSIASNQFTLLAGKYYIEWSAPAVLVDAHQSFLYNVTDTAEVKRGTSEYASSTDLAASRSFGNAVVTITASKAFEIRHRCVTSRATNGGGSPANFGTEVYTIVRIWWLG